MQRQGPVQGPVGQNLNPNISQQTGINMQTEGVFDLKNTQQGNNRVIVFKDHRRQIVDIYPTNPSFPYTENQVTTWKLKGQGVDYFNWSASILMIKAQEPNNRDCFLPFSYAGLIYRLELLSGEFPVMDVTDYGKMVWLHIIGGLEGSCYDGFTAIRYNSGGALLRGWWGGIPLITLFDNCGYYPIYNQGEELTLRITWAKNVECLTNPGNNVTYRIDDAKLVMDGLIATSGGNLDDAPFRWHTFNYLNIRTNLLPNVLLQRFSFDVKKSSMKKAIFPCFTPWATTNLAQPYLATDSTLPNLDSYYVSMGGVWFPYQRPIDSRPLWYLQLLQFFHLYDITGFTSPMWITYGSRFRSGIFGNPNRPYCDWICVIFDKLFQMASVMSGIDTERFDTQLITKFTANPNGKVMIAMFVYDCVCTLAGGQLKIED